MNRKFKNSSDHSNFFQSMILDFLTSIIFITCSFGKANGDCYHILAYPNHILAYPNCTA